VIVLFCLSNASKYTTKDGKFIVSAIKEDKSLKITFENTINANSEIDLEKIYQPYYRGKNIDNIKGSGMGLAIAKKISDLNNCGLTIDVVKNVFKVVLIIKSN
jgi:signal transduction histidine kinase